MAAKVKELVESAKEASENTGLIGNEKLRQLYATMLKCRTLEERARVLFKQSKFTGNYYAAVGQEAAAVGTAIDLRVEDTIGPSQDYDALQRP